MDGDLRPAPSLAFVIPCYNEEDVLSHLLERLAEVETELIASQRISGPASIVLVDDGSQDRTWELIEAASDGGKITGIKLSSNHGHQAALLAGLMTATADVLISMDADLQDDPAVTPQMIDAYRRGAEVVYGIRSSRENDTRFKRNTARTYYSILESMGVDIVPDHADFRLMSRKAVESLREFGEVNLFLRGIVKKLGFQSEVVEYERPERFAGESKYPIRKMLAFAVEGVTSFSVQPLRYVTWIGFSLAAFSFLYSCYAVIARFASMTVPGWASTIVPIFMLGGIQLIALGVIGEYLGKIYLEVKRRPQFIVDKIVGGDKS